MNKINLGCGRLKKDGYINIDKTQYIDGRGNKMVDNVVDVEKEALPFADNSIDEILADNVLEHIGNIEFVLNECHRVLKKEGKMVGIVPLAGTVEDFKDITHKRHFIKETFSYICGVGEAMANRPYHPRYADYGILPWNEIEIKVENNLIYFIISPRK